MRKETADNIVLGFAVTANICCAAVGGGLLIDEVQKTSPDIATALYGAQMLVFTALSAYEWPRLFRPKKGEGSF